MERSAEHRLSFNWQHPSAAQHREDANMDVRQQLKQNSCPNKLPISIIDIWNSFMNTNKYKFQIKALTTSTGIPICLQFWYLWYWMCFLYHSITTTDLRHITGRKFPKELILPNDFPHSNLCCISRAFSFSFKTVVWTIFNLLHKI